MIAQASPYFSPHAVSTRVDPPTPIAGSATGNPAVLTTTGPHGLATGDTATIAGHSTALLNAAFVVTVTGPATFSIPTNTSVAGTGGTVTRTIAVEPLTIAQGKLRAGLDWIDGDPRDALMAGFITTARQHVERRTEQALLAQTRDAYFDAVPGAVVDLPALCTPLAAVLAVTWTDTAGLAHVVDPVAYLVDTVSGRVALMLDSMPRDVRPFQGWTFRIIAGAPSVDRAPAPLVQAVGVLVGHLATLGRDVVTLGHIVAEVPQGFEDLIAPWVPVTMI